VYAFRTLYHLPNINVTALCSSLNFVFMLLLIDGHK
jgi:hypothetical protein